MTPIEDQFAKLLERRRRKAVSPATISYYQQALGRKFLPWAISRGITDASGFVVADWNAYVDELGGRGLAEQSVLTYLRGVRIFLKSVKVSLEDFDMPKAKKPMLDYLTRGELDRLESVAGNERDKLIVRVLANTGIRLGELTGLRPKDLRQITATTCRLRVTGKGAKDREVPIDVPTFKRLQAYAKRGERDYVFPALQYDRKAGALAILSGNRLRNNAVDAMFRRLKKAAKIAKPCTPHKLRHAFATHWLQSGGSIERLREILGHRDLSMIVNVYSHLTPDDSSREYERLFGGAERVEEPKKRRRIA